MYPIRIILFGNKRGPSHIHAVIREAAQLLLVFSPGLMILIFRLGGCLEHAHDLTRLKCLDDLLLQFNIRQVVVWPQTGIENKHRRFGYHVTNIISNGVDPIRVVVHKFQFRFVLQQCMFPIDIRHIPRTFERMRSKLLQVRDGVVAFWVKKVSIFHDSAQVGAKAIALLIRP